MLDSMYYHAFDVLIKILKAYQASNPISICVSRAFLLLDKVMPYIKKYI